MVEAPQTGAVVSRSRPPRFCLHLVLLLQVSSRKAQMLVAFDIGICVSYRCGTLIWDSQTYIRRAGVLISNVCPLPDDISGPKDPSFQPEPINNIEVAISEPPPWLGPSPCARLGISSVAGQPKGKYRLWCEVLPGVSKATIYRHKTSEHKIVTIGLEFYHDLGSDLLGFRSLWTEHSREVEFEEGEKVVGFRFERDDHLIQVLLIFSPFSYIICTHCTQALCNLFLQKSFSRTLLRFKDKLGF